MIKPWKVLSRTPVYRADPWLAVERQEVKLPDGRVIKDYHRITLPDCAGVLPQIEDGRFLLARQYRHGPGRVSFTLPGGALEPGELPIDGAKRELREETGYEACEWRPLGSFAMNANYGCGSVYFFLAKGAHPCVAPQYHDLEESELLLLSREELLGALREGEVAVLAAAAAILLATR